MVIDVSKDFIAVFFKVYLFMESEALGHEDDVDTIVRNVGFRNIVMYRAVVLPYYTCEGRSFLLNHAVPSSTVLTISSG